MNLSKQSYPTCSYHHQVSHICINPKCLYTPFICKSETCKSNTQHQPCQQLSFSYFILKINNPPFHQHPLFKQFTRQILGLYQFMNIQLTKSYNRFKQWRNKFGVNSNLLQLLSVIKQKDYNKISREKLLILRKQLKKQKKLNMVYSLNIENSQKIKERYGEIMNEMNSYYQRWGMNVCEQQKVEQKEKERMKLQNEEQQQIVQLRKEKYSLNKELDQIIKELKQESEEVKILGQRWINNIQQMNWRLQQQQIKKLDSYAKQFAQELSQKNINKTLLYQKIQEIKLELSKFKSKIHTQNQIHKTINHHGRLLILQNLQLSLYQQSNRQQSKLFFLGKQNSLRNHYLNSYITHSQNIINQLAKQHPNLQSIRNFSSLIQQITSQFHSTIKSYANQINTKSISRFFNKSITSFKLLYRASQHNFQVKKFWDKCQGKSNTLVIIKTQYAKIIGAYTPVAWNKFITGYKSDITKQTFLFSITQGDKFSVIEGKQDSMIFHHKGYGPTFGKGHDICIADNANMNQFSIANIGNTYSNQNYPYYNQQTWKKFGGNADTNSIRIQQWEVYELIFM